MERSVFITTNPSGKGTEVSLHIESPELQKLLQRIEQRGASISTMTTPNYGAISLEALAEDAAVAKKLAQEIAGAILFFDKVVRQNLTWKSQQAEDRPLSSVIVLALVEEKPVTVKAIMDKYMGTRGFEVSLSRILREIPERTPSKAPTRKPRR